MSIEAMKQALEALLASDSFLYNWHENESDDEADFYSTARQLNEQAITSLLQAIAEAEKQEPVLWGVVCASGRFSPYAYWEKKDAERIAANSHKGAYAAPLYTHAQPTQPDAEKQEPVAVVALVDGKKVGVIYDYSVNIDDDLYTSPPQRQPLTDEELNKVLGFQEHTTVSTKVALTSISRAVEAKLKEKNTP